MLHVAPELCFESKLRERLGNGYITADLFSNRAMVKMDITDIGYPDRSFDAIYCSHVLEHVQDDRQAMKEFHRVLSSNGWAILLVPITAEKTFEDLSVNDPAERRRLFGQHDHVRRYGPDYANRLSEAGFQVTVTEHGELVTREEAVTMGLTEAAGEIFHCTK
jgi:predicted SAM-dependent methyltransferase